MTPRTASANSVDTRQHPCRLHRHASVDRCLWWSILVVQGILSKVDTSEGDISPARTCCHTGLNFWVGGVPAWTPRWQCACVDRRRMWSMLDQIQSHVMLDARQLWMDWYWMLSDLDACVCARQGGCRMFWPGPSLDMVQVGSSLYSFHAGHCNCGSMLDTWCCSFHAGQRTCLFGLLPEAFHAGSFSDSNHAGWTATCHGKQMNVHQPGCVAAVMLDQKYACLDYHHRWSMLEHVYFNACCTGIICACCSDHIWLQSKQDKQEL